MSNANEPCTPIHPGRNREQKRKIIFELVRNIEKFEELEFEFTELLFDNEFDDYENIYRWFSESWMNLAEWMERTGRLKYTKINPYYMADNYKPVECLKFGR